MAALHPLPGQQGCEPRQEDRGLQSANTTRYSERSYSCYAGPLRQGAPSVVQHQEPSLLGSHDICPSPAAAGLCFHSPNTFLRLCNFVLPRILAGRWKATSLFPFSICITEAQGYVVLPLISGLDWLSEMELFWLVCLPF